MYACNGVLFNHESPRRSLTFVTRKITSGIANIISGKQDKLYLGNLDAKRDWGYAPEYVEAMWMMLQQEKPLDCVIATGKSHTVREFVETAFAYVDINIIWENEGVDEIGRDSKTGKVHVEIDSYYIRPTEVDTLLGDASKAKDILGWEPKVTFDELVTMMMGAELNKYA